MAARNLVFTILGIDKGSKAFDQVGKAADRASERLDGFGKVGAKVLTAMPLAAAGAGVATAGALALVGAGVIGLSAVILHNNEQVAASASALAETVREGAKAAAEPLADDLAGAMDRLRGAARDLQPEFAKLFVAAQPGVEHLTSGVIAFTRNAMPGLVTAVQSSGPVFRGMESAMADVGTGVTRFFTNLSRGAESSGQIMASFGRIARDGLGFAGSLLANLSNTGAPAVAVLEGFLRKLETTVLSLASGAFPALAAGASGFLSVGSGLLSILSALSPVLGPLIGHLGSFAVALKLIDTLSFGRVGASFTALKTQIGDATGAGGKFKAGLTGLITTGLGPLGVAAGIGALALEALGRSQQRTAERQAALNAAFRESKGAITESVRATVADQAAKDGWLQKAKDIGISAGVLTDAFLGNKAAIDEVRAAAARYTRELEGQGQLEGQVAQGADALSTKAHELVSALDDQGNETNQAAQEGKLYAEAMKSGAQGAEGLAKANKEAAEALKELRDQIDAMVSKDLAYRNAIDATKEAQDAATEAIKKHGAKSAEASDATRSLEGAYISQAHAARDLAVANSISTDEVVRGKEGALAYTQEVLNMALAAGVNAPRSLQQMVAKLQETDLMTLGAKRHVNELGQTVITLPNGKTIVVRAEDHASGTIRAIAGGRYTAVVRMQADWSGFSRSVGQGSVLSNTSARGNATGGWIHGPGTETSDSIPRMLSNKEFVVRASQAKKYGAMLEAINAGRPIPAGAMSGGAGGGSFMPTSASSGVARVVLEINSGGSRMDNLLVEVLQRAIRVRGGDVQLVLGGRAL